MQIKQTAGAVFASFSIIVSMLTFPTTLAAESQAVGDEPPLCIARPDYDAQEILWLARIMYSETKDPNEMTLIGWVVRNRVETGYFGHTYEEVATAPHQFSGLNPGDPQYDTNIHMNYGDAENTAWQNALAIAKKIYYAPSSARPISIWVRHFYSPRPSAPAPAWTKGQELAMDVYDTTGKNIRFAFYQDN